MKKIWSWYFVGVGLWVFGTAFTIWASSQPATTDVQPYVIATWTVRNAPGYVGPSGIIEVKKMVYQGCELFVVSGAPAGYGIFPVAVTTGRGCK